MQRRSIAPCSRGASCGLTSRAPIDSSAILSDVKYWTRNIPPAITAIVIAPAPEAISTATRTA